MKMRINYNDGTIDFLDGKHYDSGIHLTLDDPIMDTKVIDFSFMGKTISLLYVKTKYDLFFYEDNTIYNELLLLFKNNPQDVHDLLKKHCGSSGDILKLLKSVYSNMLQEYSLISEVYLQHFNDRYELILQYDGKIDSSTVFPVYVDSLSDAQEIFSNFNREYIENAKNRENARINEQRAKKQQERLDRYPQLTEEAFNILPDIIRMEPFVSHKGIVAFRRIIINFDATEYSFVRLYSSYNIKETIYVYNVKDLDRWIDWISKELSRQLNWSDTNPTGQETYIYIPDNVDTFARTLAFIMPELSPYIGDVYFREEKNYHGYWADWDKDEKILENYPCSVDVDDQGILAMDDDSFDLFVRIREEWEDAGIRQLVDIKRSDYDRILKGYDKSRDVCAKRINNKSKDTALQSERETKLSGIRGEKEVDYVLAWLGGNSLFVDDNTTDKFGNPCIKLKNAQFRDEVQEYDHIAIRENGVFVIETKNYGGKIVISEDGNWIHTNSKGETKGLRNPSQQVFRHETLLKSFLPKDIPIVSLICLSNPNLILEGQSNSKIPVFKSDLIAEFIVEYKSKSKLSLKRMREIKALIESYYSD